MPAIPSPVHPLGLVRSSDARSQGWGGALTASIRREEHVKVRPGVYLDRQRWTTMSPEERYLVRVHAVALSFTSPVFARQSSAAILGLPILRSRLARVHLVETTRSGSGRRGDVTVHACQGDPDLVASGGLRHTSVVRTVLDLARSLPHGEALAVADAAVRPRDATRGMSGAGAALCTPDDLLSALETSGARRGAWAAYLVVAEADPGSGSVGESLARSLFLRLGAPRPALQVALRDRDGLIGYADFCWPEYGVVGEFDGMLKYGADNPSGRAPADVVYREKLREDRIRRVTGGFFRLGWRDLDDPARVAALLSGAGVPLDRHGAAPDLRRFVVGSSAQTRLGM